VGCNTDRPALVAWERYILRKQPDKLAGVSPLHPSRRPSGGAAPFVRSEEIKKGKFFGKQPTSNIQREH